jgi:hypothetical protein
MRTGNIVEATRALDQALEKFPHDDALRGTKATLLQRLAYWCFSRRISGTAHCRSIANSRA